MSSGSYIAINIVICVRDCDCDCVVGRGGKGGISKLLARGCRDTTASCKEVQECVGATVGWEALMPFT